MQRTIQKRGTKTEGSAGAAIPVDTKSHPKVFPTVIVDIWKNRTHSKFLICHSATSKGKAVRHMRCHFFYFFFLFTVLAFFVIKFSVPSLSLFLPPPLPPSPHSVFRPSVLPVPDSSDSLSCPVTAGEEKEKEKKGGRGKVNEKIGEQEK